MSLKNVIFADVWRIYGDASWAKVFAALFKFRAFRPVFSYRLANYFRTAPFYLKIFYPFTKLIHRWFQASINCEIPIEAKIGSGFFLSHGYVVVINSQAKIGNNFTCLHLVTIGGKRDVGVPTIGDNVTVAAGAMVVGKVNVANNVTIGAGTLVFKDCAENSIIVGNPQKVLREADELRTINPAPQYLIQ